MKRSISRQLLEPHSPASDPTIEGTIICMICQATYAPSRLHAYLLHAPPLALESAFMSMCHFCFRCRRPSCPNCWDTIHGVCGQCAHETHVPFRIETPPLEGISHLSPPSSFPGDERSTPLSLVSVQHGRFKEFSFSPVSTISTRLDHSYFSQGRFPTRSAGTFVTSSPGDIDKIETRPDRSASQDIDKIETRPDRSASRYIDKRATRFDLFVSRKRKFVRLLMVLSFLIFFLVVFMILAAFLSVDANLFIYRILHFDIHAELSALWHFLSHLF